MNWGYRLVGAHGSEKWNAKLRLILRPVARVNTLHDSYQGKLTALNASVFNSVVAYKVLKGRFCFLIFERNIP